ncbi:TRAP transporter large permease [Noviherbaspirillum sp. CPCC 100848]|uniref:TRAP transporter large permease protein n=1 Tax=Noviherbaspirillum album TaxID=3080276 RepID=A0ABU6JGE1_9BURK|nr:TRAP transporter large permease [Noviherbaspirillum sp. CPCC 100848]MEC4722741.1 TRAP transporter large permease [Noviherbaspirillum sp. CPCC 100848]
MSVSAWILTAGFALLVLLGFPFSFAIGISVIGVLYFTDIPAVMLPQTIISGTQSFSLLGIPFFMLAGEIMSAGGMSKRLVAMADVLVRHLPGGLGHVTILAAVIFAAISGSAPATTAAIGAIMIPAMAERGYSKAYATSLAVSAGVLAPLIPPSIAFVIWGVIAEQSISKLFLAGILPGLLMAGGLSLLVAWNARGNHVTRLPRATFTEVCTAFREGIWALLAPFIVLAGIYGGAFTPTEAAAVACLYSLWVGVFVEKRIKVRDLPEIFINGMRVSAIVMAVMAASSGFSVLIAQEQIATKFAGALGGAITQPWLMLLVLNLVFFLLAAVMDEVAIMVILGPMLIAIANQFGVDPIHFGAVIVTNVAVGMAAPPIGYCLFVGMAISGQKLGEVSRAIWPQILVMLAVLLLTTYIPQFALVFIN